MLSTATFSGWFFPPHGLKVKIIKVNIKNFLILKNKIRKYLKAKTPQKKRLKIL